MKEFEPKIKEPKIKNLYEFLDFLEGEFGENVTKKLFKPILEQRARADIVVGSTSIAKKERIKRLKNTEVTPITVAKLNHIIDARLKSLEIDFIDLRHSERLEKKTRKEEEEMLSAMKGKEIVTDGEGNVEVKIKS